MGKRAGWLPEGAKVGARGEPAQALAGGGGRSAPTDGFVVWALPAAKEIPGASKQPGGEFGRATGFRGSAGV